MAVDVSKDVEMCRRFENYFICLREAFQKIKCMYKDIFIKGGRGSI